MKTAYAETWNLGVEQSVASNAIVSIQYVGSHGVHDYDISNLNPSSGGGTFLGDGGGSGYNSYYASSNRLNMQYANMNYRSDNGYSFYDALLLGFRANNLHRTGLTINANYQWSHTLDNLSSTFTDAANGTQSALYQLGYLDAFKPKLNYGNADYDIRHRFVTNVSWETPWFKNSANKLERYALGGWVVGGNVNIRSGAPFSIYDCDNQTNTGCPLYATSAHIARSGKATNGSKGIYSYITLPVSSSANATTGALAGQVVDAGNSLGMPNCSGLYHLGCSYVQETGTEYPARNQFIGPANWNSNIQFLKNFKFTERLGVQLRAEMYNVFNHHNQYIASMSGNDLDVSSMNSTVSSKQPDTPVIQAEKGGIYGQPGQSTDEHRTIDFGAKITF
jgi:hypothetical protein